MARAPIIAAMSIVVLAALLSLLWPSSGNARGLLDEMLSEDEIDMFKLWNDCLPVALLIAGGKRDSIRGETVKISKKIIVKMLSNANFRRNAGIPDPISGDASLWAILDMSNTPEEQKFSVSLQFHKTVRDLASGINGDMVTWAASIKNKNGNSYVVWSAVRRLMKIFINEYLRVNADACEKQPKLPQ